jgi:MFS family permease
MNYAWVVVALLFPVALLNYLDRQMLATMKASMVGDIPSIANKEDWGWVLGCFKWTYAVLSPFGGYIADRFSKRHIIGISLFVWSAVTWWTGHVTSFNELIVARAFMGISEAFYIPTALALIADYHLGDTRSRAIGVHQTGIYIGQILGGFAGYVADSPDHGWRWAFSTCGMVGVIYALPLIGMLCNPVRIADDRLQVAPAGNAFKGLLGNRNFLLLILYFTLPAIAGWVVRDWMPDILKEKFGLGQGKAGMSAILYVQIASIVGALLGGFMADRWMPENAINGRYIWLPVRFDSRGNPFLEWEDEWNLECL